MTFYAFYLESYQHVVWHPGVWERLLLSIQQIQEEASEQFSWPKQTAEQTTYLPVQC